MKLLHGLGRTQAAVGAIMAAFLATFLPLTLLRHDAFFTARYDLGNMTQAVWSVAHGGLYRVTDPAGAEVSRLGSHVDPILGLLAPIWRVWPDPRMLIVVQALAVASAAIPAFLLARRWLADDRAAVAFAAVALLYPAVQWATIFDFHPVTLAVPLLLWCVWAADARHDVALGVCAILALATKEQVGFALAILGLWMAVSLGRRRAGALLAAVSLAWTAIAVWVVIPHFNEGDGSALVSERYGALGDGPGDVIVGVFTKPWEVVQIVATADRASYFLALTLPLLLLSLRAPLLAAGALPDLALNLLSSRPEQHQIQYHYGAVIAPFLIAAAIRGLAALRKDADRHGFTLPVAWVAAALVVAGVFAGYRHGPLPFWASVPGGSPSGSAQFTVTAHARVLAEATRTIPADATVSAGNHIGGHLSARRQIATFPVIAGADYVVVDERTPDIVDRREPAFHAASVARLRADPAYALVFTRDGVLVFARKPAT